MNLVRKILIIVFLGFLTYAPSLFNGFVWDDEVMFQKMGGMQQGAVYFRPVISTIYWAIFNIFGPRPFFFHFFQLIFHITTAILIYYLFKRFFKETLSLLLALVFLVHPALVEAVSFASAMQEVVFTLVGVVALYIITSNKTASIFKVFLSVALLLTAVLLKETAVVFFLLVFIYLYIFQRKNRSSLIIYSILASIILIAYFLFRVSIGNIYTQGQGLFPIMRVYLVTRLLNIPAIFQYYLSMFIYPINLAIAQHWVIRSPNFSNFFLPLFLEIIFVLSIIIYSLKRKNKDFIFFSLWFLIGTLPHLQIIPLNMTVAERWLYFPMIGLLGIIGVILTKFDSSLRENDLESSPRRRGSSLLIILVILIISIFSIRSFIRTLDWRNGLTLFSHDIKKDSSFDLQNNMGVELFRVGKIEQSKKYFEKSVLLAPYWWVNWNNLGVVYEREKNIEKATECYKKSITNGQYFLAYENLAKILVMQGDNSKEAEEILRTALKLFPEDNNLRQTNRIYLQKLDSQK